MFTVATGESDEKPTGSFTNIVFCICVILPVSEMKFVISLLVKRKTGLRALAPARTSASDMLSSKWHLRYELRVFLFAVSTVLRLLLAPIWICFLLVEMAVASVVYGLLSFVLERNPLAGVVRDLKESTLMSLGAEPLR